MTSFITELRTAHAVFTAHAAGADTLGQIAHRTGLDVRVCAEWTRLLRLKITNHQRKLAPPPPKLEFDI